MRLVPPFLVLLTAAGCASNAPPPPPVRTPVPMPPPRPVLVALPGPDWRDRPVTPGTWTYARDSRGSVARFGQAGADALAVLRCDVVQRRLFVSRAGGAAGPFTVRTSTTTRQLPTAPTGGQPPYAAAALPAGDPLLDAMAFSRGRFALEQPGEPPLALPAWAEIGRVIEDCRS